MQQNLDNQIGTMAGIHGHEMNQMAVPAGFTPMFENNRFKRSGIDIKNFIDVKMGANRIPVAI
jgi:hypothetical protein